MGRMLKLFLCMCLILTVTAPIYGATPTEYMISNKPEGVFGGQLVVPHFGNPETFNPITATEHNTIEALDVVFDSLVSFDETTSTYKPRLAKSWSNSEDNRSFVFSIRRGVKFHDGIELTAKDVKFTFEVVTDPEIKAPFRDKYSLSKDEMICELLDDYTLKITFKEESTDVLELFSSLKVIPMHLLEGPWKEGRFNDFWGVNTPLKQIIGTGPYCLNQLKLNEYITYSKNTNFWMVSPKKKQLPYITRYVRVFAKDYPDQILKFLSGQIDIAYMEKQAYEAHRDKQSKYNFTFFKFEEQNAYIALRNTLKNAQPNPSGPTLHNIEEVFYVK